MNILVITSVFPRWHGDATPPFVFNTCRDLVEAGCTITVLAPHDGGAKMNENMEGINVLRYPYFYPFSQQALCYEGGMLVQLRTSKWKTLQLPLLACAQLSAIKHVLGKGSFDLIHAHSLLPQGLLSTLANNLNLPLVISSHGADVFLLKKQWAPLLSMAGRKADALIANSQATRSRLIDLGVNEKKIHNIPATPNYDDPLALSHTPPSPPFTILFAGRVIEEKGIDLLVAAIPALRDQFPGLMLRIAGSGKLEATLKKNVQKKGWDPFIKFLGWLDSKALRKEMTSAHLLVTPSRMIEGQNLVVTEALSVGCPVATTPKGGVLDLIQQDKTGFIIPQTTVPSIIETVSRALSSPNERKSYSSAGFFHFKKNYSRNKITNLTTYLYQQLLKT